MSPETASNLAAPSLPRGFAAGYSPRMPVSDEMLEADGSLRTHWRMFVNLIDDLGRDELIRRWEQARRLIRENGITHNVYGDPNGLDRPWSLDLVPLLVPAPEWRAVSEALSQRARLLDMILADLYGQGRIISLGLLPPDLIYGNPGFLRPCHGITPPKGHYLHLYAADMIRGGDGELRVLMDRTQAPSGAGYTLENRIVLSRVLPTIFRQCNVQRLAPFFMTLRQTLTSLAPANRENPRVVLLTPGPYNETYFEHAYLARYLGYTLVQGNDLTVRDSRVYLKTLSGLQRVDVILRRVDDDYCDSLELYPNSFLGVPGLVQAVREGTVAVANALGSGVLQAPAYLPYLPALCRHFLAEELRVQSVRTWWCGDAASLKYVLSDMPRLVIKPAFPTRDADTVFGHDLTREQLDRLAARIVARPGDFVAQEHIDSRTAPVLLNDSVQSRRFVLRAYLAASPEGFSVMAGGLTRVTGADESLVVSLQKGGGAKDTWILADGPVNEVSLLTSASRPVELSRGGGDLPSRVADDLFWLGRYVQRAEGVVRTARCVFGRLMDPTAALTLKSIMASLLGKSAPVLGDAIDRDLADALFGSADAARLRRTLDAVHNLARALRDRISADAWRILQSVGRDLAEFAALSHSTADDPLAAAIELLNSMVSGFLAFGGIAAESMTRGQAWRFLDLGQRVERSTQTALLIRTLLVDVSPEEGSILDAVLEIADSSLTYRRRYLTQLEAVAVVDLLVADDGNPRAIAYQAAAIEEHLAHLPHDPGHPSRSPDRQKALDLRTTLQLADLAALCKATGEKRPGLDALIQGVLGHLNSIAEHLSQIYFSHAASRRLISTAPGGSL